MVVCRIGHVQFFLWYLGRFNFEFSEPAGSCSSNTLTFSEPNEKRVSKCLSIMISQHANGCFLFCL